MTHPLLAAAEAYSKNPEPGLNGNGALARLVHQLSRPEQSLQRLRLSVDQGDPVGDLNVLPPYRLRNGEPAESRRLMPQESEERYRKAANSFLLRRIRGLYAQTATLYEGSTYVHGLRLGGSRGVTHKSYEHRVNSLLFMDSDCGLPFGPTRRLIESLGLTAFMAGSKSAKADRFHVYLSVSTVDTADLGIKPEDELSTGNVELARAYSLLMSLLAADVAHATATEGGEFDPKALLPTQFVACGQHAPGVRPVVPSVLLDRGTHLNLGTYLRSWGLDFGALVVMARQLFGSKRRPGAKQRLRRAPRGAPKAELRFLSTVPLLHRSGHGHDTRLVLQRALVAANARPMEGAYLEPTWGEDGIASFLAAVTGNVEDALDVVTSARGKPVNQLKSKFGAHDKLAFAAWGRLAMQNMALMNPDPESISYGAVAGDFGFFSTLGRRNLDKACVEQQVAYEAARFTTDERLQKALRSMSQCSSLSQTDYFFGAGVYPDAKVQRNLRCKNVLCPHCTWTDLRHAEAAADRTLGDDDMHLFVYEQDAQGAPLVNENMTSFLRHLRDTRLWLKGQTWVAIKEPLEDAGKLCYRLWLFVSDGALYKQRFGAFAAEEPARMAGYEGKVPSAFVRATAAGCRLQWHTLLFEALMRRDMQALERRFDFLRAKSLVHQARTHAPDSGLLLVTWPSREEVSATMRESMELRSTLPSGAKAWTPWACAQEFHGGKPDYHAIHEVWTGRLVWEGRGFVNLKRVRAKLTVLDLDSPAKRREKRAHMLAQGRSTELEHPTRRLMGAAVSAKAFVYDLEALELAYASP